MHGFKGSYLILVYEHIVIQFCLGYMLGPGVGTLLSLLPDFLIRCISMVMVQLQMVDVDRIEPSLSYCQYTLT